MKYFLYSFIATYLILSSLVFIACCEDSKEDYAKTHGLVCINEQLYKERYETPMFVFGDWKHELELIGTCPSGKVDVNF